MKGLPHDPVFPKCDFEDCSVVVGGNLDGGKKEELFCGADNLAFQNLQKGEKKLLFFENLNYFNAFRGKFLSIK